MQVLFKFCPKCGKDLANNKKYKEIKVRDETCGKKPRFPEINLAEEEGLNYRMQGHLFPYHGIKKVLIVFRSSKASENLHMEGPEFYNRSAVS